MEKEKPHFKKVITTPEQFKKEVEKQNKEGFELWFEKSIIIPCENCGKICLLFRNKDWERARTHPSKWKS